MIAVLVATKKKGTKALTLSALAAAAVSLSSFVPMHNAAAQDRAGGATRSNGTLAADERVRVVEGVLTKLQESYVFPDVAKKMAEVVRGRAKNKEYDAITDPQAFARKLTDDLRAVSSDKHLSVIYSPDVLPPSSPDETTWQETETPPPGAPSAAGINYGFEKAERLAGNVGYLEVRGFPPPDAGAAEACAAAMTFLSNTDALILDLRRNGGGEPSMVALLCSYFFEAGEEVHLNDIYWRPDGETRQFKTRKQVAGKRYGRARDVYVLTSGRTFSGGEECAYNLQNLKRATLIGETTGGGAHPGGVRRVTDHFGVWVPMGRAISPVTKTNWEGAGVVPSVKAPTADALRVAHKIALEKQLAKASGDARRQEGIRRAIAALEPGAK